MIGGTRVVAFALFNRPVLDAAPVGARDNGHETPIRTQIAYARRTFFVGGAVSGRARPTPAVEANPLTSADRIRDALAHITDTPKADLLGATNAIIDARRKGNTPLIQAAEARSTVFGNITFVLGGIATRQAQKHEAQAPENPQGVFSRPFS